MEVLRPHSRKADGGEAGSRRQAGVLDGVQACCQPRVEAEEDGPSVGADVVRSDVLSEDCKLVDLEKLKPVSRLGGITYGRTTPTYELPTPHLDNLADYQYI